MMYDDDNNDDDDDTFTFVLSCGLSGYKLYTEKMIRHVQNAMFVRLTPISMQ